MENKNDYTVILSVRNSGKEFGICLGTPKRIK